MKLMKNSKKAFLAVAVVAFLFSASFLMTMDQDSDVDAATTGTITIGEEVYTDLASAVEGATDGDTLVLSEGVFEVGSSVFVISKDISLVGAGTNTIITNNGASTSRMIEYVYKNGYDINISNIQFKGYGIAGLLYWGAAANLGEGSIPKLTVTDCLFRGNHLDGYSNTGIGFFGNGTASSEVLIRGCTFDHNKEAVYLDDEGPQTGLKVFVEGNKFIDTLYSAVYGVLTNVMILNNEIDSSNGCGVDFILNGTNTNVNVVIEGNTIDSETAISIAPYKLNEGSVTEIRPSDIPVIRNNVREVDDILVKASIYRYATSTHGYESVSYLPGSIDVNNNYCSGVQPTVSFGASNTNGIPPGDPSIIDNLIIESNRSVINDTFYTDTSLSSTNNDVQVPGIDDSEDIPYPPVIEQGAKPTNTNSKSDDNTKLVAAAAAIVVIMLAAVALMVNRNN